MKSISILMVKALYLALFNSHGVRAEVDIPAEVEASSPVTGVLAGRLVSVQTVGLVAGLASLHLNNFGAMSRVPCCQRQNDYGKACRSMVPLRSMVQV